MLEVVPRAFTGWDAETPIVLVTLLSVVVKSEVGLVVVAKLFSLPGMEVSGADTDAFKVSWVLFPVMER